MRRRAVRVSMNTLLIADDEEMNITILARKLQRLGYVTIDAFDGEDAVSKVREYTRLNHSIPAAVLMDINMPNMNGIEATRILKEEFKNLPIIAVTAFALENFDYGANGFDHLCRKPVDFKELVAKIELCKITQ
ncbi:MAG: response regulator [Proteobacteria bacterium]|nr:MAG: response regulator [Pseudomonadota bacterium]